MNAVNTTRDSYNITVKGLDLYIDYKNNRLKIINFTHITKEKADYLVNYASSKKLGKIICICTIESVETFLNKGFVKEALIKGFFNGKDGFYLSFFVNEDRALSNNIEKEDSILKECSLHKECIENTNKKDFLIRNAIESDIPQLIKVFNKVFSTYPTPISDTEYIKRMMTTNVLYKVAEMDGDIVGVASADMDKLNLNAEITDCATLTEFRGNGIMSGLIYYLEYDLKQKDYHTLYSICRALNPGINFVLSKHRYTYSGKLINNCNICGGYENMNVWVKELK